MTTLNTPVKFILPEGSYGYAYNTIYDGEATILENGFFDEDFYMDDEEEEALEELQLWLPGYTEIAEA